MTLQEQGQDLVMSVGDTRTVHVTASGAALRYQEAVRHSSRVRFLRRAIPIGAVLTVAAIGFVAIVEPFRTLPAGLSVGPLSMNGTKVTMEMPRLTGFKKDNRPYEVTARWAAQDIKTPTIIELREINARIALQERGMATVQALAGVYNTNSETILLKDDVRVKTDGGYDAKLKSATVEFKAGTVVSREPVTVEFSGGTIDADGLEMVDNGARVLFQGRVRTVMKMDGAADAAQKGTKP
jgi:lipopolysaccharide export system protein LptC